MFPSTIHPKAVHSQHLRAMGREEAAVSNDRYVRHNVKKKYYRPFLVTGDRDVAQVMRPASVGSLGWMWDTND